MTRMCPNCKTIELRQSIRQQVEIDYCPQCNGIWLDSGELRKIIDHYAQRNTSSVKKTSAQSAEPSNYQIKNKSKAIKHTGNVIEALFDIFDIGG